MTRFLSLGFGAGLINADRIDKIVPVHKDQSRAILNDGSSVMVSGDVYAVEK